ncbi:MAG: metallophosphoesterase family protein [Candidatus Heteroscillospira sp.]|jgi:exonuclease SbcD
MKPLKLLCSADWHMDSPFRALNALQSREMRERARLLPGLLRDTAVERGADMLLLSGDLFDSGRPYLESARELERAFEGLDIPVFISPGNHDYCSADSPWERLVLPDNVHVFRKNRPECVPTDRAMVYGAAFTEPESRDILSGFSAPRTPGKYNLLVLHADLDGAGAYCPLPSRELARSGFDFAALGHIHRPVLPKKLGDTWYCYPGCPMGRGFDECGARGAMLITLDGSSCSGEFIELSRNRYETIEVPVTGRDACEALSEAVSRARPGDICRFVLTGESSRPVPPGLVDTLAAKRGLFAARLTDRTAPPASDEGGLRGALIRRFRLRMESAGSETQRRELREALRWALAALDGGEEPLEVRR